MRVGTFKQQLINILSDPRVSQKARSKPIKLIPFTLDEEYACHWLHVGFVAPKKFRPREDTFSADPNDAKHVSFFTLPDFNSLSLNTILSMAGGIDRHAEDVAGTTAKIEKELAGRIGNHMTIKSLEQGEHDRSLKFYAEHGFDTGTSGVGNSFQVTTMPVEQGLEEIKKILDL